MQIPRNQNMDTNTFLTSHVVNTQSPCRITRLLTNDRFRGQRRVVTMTFLQFSTTPAAEKNAF